MVMSNRGYKNVLLITFIHYLFIKDSSGYA